MANNQMSLFDDIYVDNFAGGGGASTGIELATGQPITIAINHDESAIMMHKRNHPFTEHYQEDVWMIDPREVTKGRHVRLAWFSPDCKHFSRAKGAALVDKHIRGLAWIVLKWAGLVRPDVIMLENVPEFVTWCPVRKGRPVKKKTGQTFKRWKSQLEALGYVIDTRNLCAADYGAPTIRTRFCLIARCDGKPIQFPEPTHAPADSLAVKSGRLKPWRAAAEIIDWSLPCYSIFESKETIKNKYGARVVRPLRPNTQRRIAKGLDKFVLKSAKPFIVPIGYGERAGQEPRTHDIEQPLSTVVSSTKQYVCKPEMTPYIVTNNGNNVPHSVEEPLPTITTGNRNLLLSPSLAPFIAQHKYNNVAQDIQNPLSTVTAVGAHELITPSLIQYHSEQRDSEARGQDLSQPLRTVDAANRYGLSAVHLTQYFSGEGHYHSVEEPLATITSMEREGVTAAYLSEWYGTARDGLPVDKPLATITSKDREALTVAHIAHFKGQDKGQSPSEPLMTITQCDGQFAEVITTVIKYDSTEDTSLGFWPAIRNLLNEYCEYHLGDDELLLMEIDGVQYYLADIGLRMLSPRELYDAMGFPHDYIIDKDSNGNKIKRADQVARCGNAVCPAISEALVKANLPECPEQSPTTMRELHRRQAIAS